MQKIETFTTDEARFLSNFYPYKKNGGKYPHLVKIIYNNIVFDCVENAYQAAKSPDRNLQLEFSKMSPYDTKAYWETHTEIRTDWDDVKLSLMTDFVWQKFYSNSNLAQMLIATQDAVLEEGNDWGDVFWGICEGKGENKLGKILMDLRSELKTKQKLINEAKNVSGRILLNDDERNAIGAVGAALITKDGNLYTGICMEMVCGMGFCAETAALAEMIKNRETQIEMIVAAKHDGKIIPPCGRCREMLYQLDHRNLDTKIIIGEMEIKTLDELLPERWTDKT